jgi:hypothetical protein
MYTIHPLNLCTLYDNRNFFALLLLLLLLPPAVISATVCSMFSTVTAAYNVNALSSMYLRVRSH